MIRKVYYVLAALILGTYAWAEIRGLDFPSGERDLAGQKQGVRGVYRSGGFHGGK